MVGLTMTRLSTAGDDFKKVYRSHVSVGAGMHQWT